MRHARFSIVGAVSAKLPCAHGPSRAASSMLPYERSERADNKLDKTPNSSFNREEYGQLPSARALTVL